LESPSCLVGCVAEGLQAIGCLPMTPSNWSAFWKVPAAKDSAGDVLHRGQRLHEPIQRSSAKREVNLELDPSPA
jgi:hypothetical protein